MSWFRRLLIACNNGKEIKPDVPGVPEVEKDEDGNVTSYTNTDTVSVTETGTTINTEFIPFDGKNWTMHIYAHFAYSEQTTNYPTLLGCMESVSPWAGITIRYESSQLYCIFNDGGGTKHYYTLSTDSSGNVDITITYTDDVANATNNGTQFMSNVTMNSMSLEDLELVLLCDTEGANRYGIGTIYEFYIKKT